MTAEFRALELGEAYAGRFAGMLLAALGVEVTQIGRAGVSAENSNDSDTADRFRRAYADGGKQRLALDLADAADRDRLRSAIAEADVLIDTLPRGLEDVGLTVDELRVAHPELAIVSISPFGRSGPRAHWKAVDLIVQATGGLLASSGSGEAPPARLAGEQGAHVSAVFAAIAACAAVRGVRSGASGGAHIDISMQEVLSTHWTREIGRYVYTGEGLARSSERTGLQGFPHTARTSDGYVFLLALRAAWEDFALFLGLEDFVAGEWADPEVRVRRWSEIEPAFAAAMASRGRYEWFADGAARGYTLAPIDDASSVVGSPQLEARRYFDEIEVDGTQLPAPGLPFWTTVQHVEQAEQAP